MSIIASINRKIFSSNGTRQHLLRLFKHQNGNSPFKRNHFTEGCSLGKSTSTFMHEDPKVPLAFRDINKTGFTLTHKIYVVGPIILCGNGILSWKVNSADDITADSLSIFTTLYPVPEIVVIGLDKGFTIDPAIKKYLLENNIKVEALPVRAAINTYNFLTCDHRKVAGAFIPPAEDLPLSKLPPSEDKREFLESSS